MTDSHMTLQVLRRTLATVLEGLEHPPLGAVAALAEETGEVAKLLLDHHAYGLDLDRSELASELMDVLVCLCEIATRYDIDLDAAAKLKLSELAVRAPRWRESHGERLRRIRDRE